MNRWTTLIVVFAVLAVMAVPAVAERIDEVRKELTQANRKLNSYTARIQSSHEFPMGEQGSYSSESKGTYEWMRDGQLVKYRSEVETDAIQKTAGQETKSSTTSLTVCDGRFMYAYSVSDGRQSAIKHNADPKAAGDPSLMLEDLRSEYDLQVLPDDTANGRSCFVIEAKATKKLNHPIRRQVMFFSKESGIAVRILGYDDSGKVVFASNTTDIKTNVDLAPDRFKFEAPEGVTVMDLSASP